MKAQNIRSLVRKAHVSNDIREYIESCDILYKDLSNNMKDLCGKSACRKLLTMEYYLTEDNMGDICARYCNRFRNLPTV